MSASLEKRVAALERQVALLQQHGATVPSNRAWLDDLYGVFADDPVFEKAMELGRRYRRSLRPRGRKSGPKR